MFVNRVRSRRFPVEGALEKSVRAAGLTSNFAEHYASEVLKRFPGKTESATRGRVLIVSCTGRSFGRFD